MQRGRPSQAGNRFSARFPIIDERPTRVRSRGRARAREARKHGCARVCKRARTRVVVACNHKRWLERAESLQPSALLLGKPTRADFRRLCGLVKFARARCARAVTNSSQQLLVAARGARLRAEPASACKTRDFLDQA